MDNSLTLRLHSEISNRFLNLDFLKKTDLNISTVREFIESPSFIESLNTIVQNRDYSCRAVFDLCKNFIEELTQGDAPDNWLYYIYQFALSKSFPDAVNIKLLKHLDMGCLIYLEILSVICQYEKIYDDGSWTGKYPLEFLTSEEENQLENKYEYRKFKKAFTEEYVYEMMKLNQEVLGYSSLDHICGVHYLALYIGRQLKLAGLPVDLGRVSGAAAGHDIGKFGCKGEELKRVPYLHYYYTDQWFKKHDINYIRNIAINHSTWDLELENLSLESLILIYCDFRVKKKNSKTANNKSKMHIYSLQESFEVILNKLDNLDKTKEMRYCRVYAKLKDFEDYMLDLGIDVVVGDKVIAKENREVKKKYYSLMRGQEITENMKYLSINHNINLMYRLRDETSLGSLLEIARSETDPNNLREYLNIFEEYSTYLTQKQKLITIKFLYEGLIHSEEDIRKQCGKILGTLIALFDEVYSKEVPPSAELETPELTSYKLLDRYLTYVIYQNQKIIPIHRMWLGNSISTIIFSLFSNCRENQIKGYIKTLLKYYKKEDLREKDIKLHLLNSIKYIPISKCKEESVEILFKYIIKMLDEENKDLRLSAIEATYNLIPKLKKGSKLISFFRRKFSADISFSDFPVENFLRYKIANLLRLDHSITDKYESFLVRDTEKIPDIYLSNLKTATDWVTKKIQIDLLLEHTLTNPESMGIHTAMHFCNLLKVSASESVRNRGGEGLIRIMPHLSLDQRNDIAIELLRALEIEGYQFTKYIPYYLGQIILYLQPVELDELIDDLIEKIKQSSPQVTSLLLKTVGVAIENYPKYRELFNEEKEKYEERFIRLLSILLNGLVNYNLQVKQVAFSVIGKEIFGSRKLNLDQKNEIFILIAKKILTLLGENQEDKELLFLTNASGLNHIYRFISDYKFYRGNIDLKVQDKIAFFPGTFDPFSLSHKEIAKEIRNLGYEVYLAIDEFSWSKRTQPNLIRRNIVRMSIADELGVYLFPEDIQINISNPNDLKRLKKEFYDLDVYIVVGSDVVLNASAYAKNKGEDSVLSFSHIIFERKSMYASEGDGRELDEIIENIDGKVIRLSLPPQYEDISSTQIRSYIDENRDISKLVDPLVQKYIYDRGLYRREPKYKTLLQTKSISIEIRNRFTNELLKELASVIPTNFNLAYKSLKEFSRNLTPRVLIVRDIKRNGDIIGFSAFHCMRASMLLKEFKDSMISEYVRNNYVGRTIVIDGIFVNSKSHFQNLQQMILTETLTFCLAKDYTYGVFKNMIKEYPSNSLYEILKLQGFERVPYGDINNPVFVVNMTAPCTLSLDIETIMKDPFASNLNVKRTINRTRRRLQSVITSLFPGHLLLSFDRYMVYENMIKKICDENGVPTEPMESGELGPAVCVPFGALLNGCIIPNTVTKSLHTEKLFSPNVKNYRIGAYPYYMSLENQVKMLRSFGRPAILVDDLLHKGYRIKVLDPLLKKEDIDVKKIVVGILSGRGKELMDLQGREVDCAYFIPKLRNWFNESFMYPFVDGDTVWRGIYPQRNLVPSVNLILPYTSPTFIKGTSKEAIYDLSRVCIENSIDIFLALEEEYQRINERKLTLAHLGEVFLSPKYPDHGDNMNYDLNLNPSHYLKNDLNHLKRLEHIICSE